jgi:hypothetical protein
MMKQSSLRGFVDGQIRARLPAPGRRVFDAPASQARTDHQPKFLPDPLGLRAHALRPTNRGEAVPRHLRFGSSTIQSIYPDVVSAVAVDPP